MADKKDIQKAVARMMKAFTAFRPDPDDMKDFMELVYEKLSPFPPLVIDKAVEKIIETEIYFPRIAEMLAHCYQARDVASAELWNRYQSLKSDWYGDVIHPREVWQKVADDYKAVGFYSNAQAVMDDYKKYGKKCEPISAEQVEEARKKLAKIAEAK